MIYQAYAPPRDVASKVRRRLTQWRAAKPARLAFNEPVLSITFDDFPVTAATEGARILENHGARGTFYAAGAMMDRPGPSGRNFSAADIARLVAAGHEIGCHSYAHDDAAQCDVFDSLQDLAKNRAALIAMGAPSPRAHAFPYGETTTQLKEGLPPRFATARGILPGLNHGPTDLAQLRACPLFGAGWQARMHDLLKRASHRNAWVIGFTHDVSDDPSPWGTRGLHLDELIDTALALGFTILPVSDALERRLA
jgi:peptidoglycan/xylan/chitin deacetylase (PgdA/CDA1 family)